MERRNCICGMPYCRRCGMSPHDTTTPCFCDHVTTPHCAVPNYPLTEGLPGNEADDDQR